MVKMRERAELLGGAEQEHFVFASYKPVHGQMEFFDPTRAMRSWKKAWSKSTAKAGLNGLRFHDLRHDAISKLLTDPSVSAQTVKAIAGHVSQRMLNRYSHIELDARREALEALSGKGYVIKHVINSLPDGSSVS